MGADRGWQTLHALRHGTMNAKERRRFMDELAAAYLRLPLGPSALRPDTMTITRRDDHPAKKPEPTVEKAETRRPAASGPEREQAMMALFGVMNQVVRALAQHSNLGVTQLAAQFERHYEVLVPPMETAQERGDREQTEKRDKETAKTHAHA